MSGQFFLIPRRRAAIRDVARRAYLDHPNDCEAASAQASQEILAGSIVVAILLGVAIQLAIDLIVYWIKESILEPSADYQAGEPGFDDDQ